MAKDYSYRRTLWEKETKHTLGEEELSISVKGKTTKQIPYSDVNNVKLQYYGSMNGHPNYACILKTRQGKVIIGNVHFVSTGNFESRNSGYRRFVADLHDKLRPHADQIKFRQGTEWLFWFCVVMALIMPPLFLLGIYLLFFSNDRGNFSARGSLFAVPALMLFFIVPTLRKGRSKKYDPAELPKGFLP